jgi:hypothetical protein
MEKVMDKESKVRSAALEALIAEVAKDPPTWADYSSKSLLVAWDGEVLDEVKQGVTSGGWHWANRLYIDRESAKKACERSRNG